MESKWIVVEPILSIPGCEVLGSPPTSVMFAAISVVVGARSACSHSPPPSVSDCEGRSTGWWVQLGRPCIRDPAALHRVHDKEVHGRRSTRFNGPPAPVLVFQRSSRRDEMTKMHRPRAGTYGTKLGQRVSGLLALCVRRELAPDGTSLAIV